MEGKKKEVQRNEVVVAKKGKSIRKIFSGLVQRKGWTGPRKKGSWPERTSVTEENFKRKKVVAHGVVTGKPNNLRQSFAAGGPKTTTTRNNEIAFNISQSCPKNAKGNGGLQQSEKQQFLKVSLSRGVGECGVIAAAKCWEVPALERKKKGINWRKRELHLRKTN